MTSKCVSGVVDINEKFMLLRAYIERRDRERAQRSVVQSATFAESQPRSKNADTVNSR